MKKAKLNLKSLKVQSFVTSVDNEKSEVKGGCPVYSDSIQPCACTDQTECWATFGQGPYPQANCYITGGYACDGGEGF
ncbi:MAG: pinensin family lanthipeptide [Bacteroidota bacterium]